MCKDLLRAINLKQARLRIAYLSLVKDNDGTVREETVLVRSEVRLQLLHVGCTVHQTNGNSNSKFALTVHRAYQVTCA